MATHFIIKLNSSLEFINSFYYDTFNSITFLHYIFFKVFFSYENIKLSTTNPRRLSLFQAKGALLTDDAYTFNDDLLN